MFSTSIQCGIKSEVFEFFVRMCRASIKDIENDKRVTGVYHIEMDTHIMTMTFFIFFLTQT